MMSGVEGAAPWIWGQLESLLGGRPARVPLWLGGFAAIWMLHLAAALEDEEAFAIARRYVDHCGGINPDLLLHPPSWGGDVNDPDEWESSLREQAASVPSLQKLRAAWELEPSNDDIIQVALEELLFEGAGHAAFSLARAMHTPT